MNKLKFDDSLKLQMKNNSLIVQQFFNLQNHPTFHSEERLVNLERGRACFVGLSILLGFGDKYIHQVRGSTKSKSVFI